MDTAILGIAKCGCIVACDLDNTQANQTKYLDQGYSIQIKPTQEAMQLFQNSHHKATCK